MPILRRNCRDKMAAFVSLALAAGPALAGAPFRTDDPGTTPDGHFEFDLFSQGIKSDDGWTAGLPAFEADYGALPNLQLHIVVAQGYVAVENSHAGFALSDVELGAKYRFISPSNDDWFPQVATFPLIEVPVGNQKLGLSTGHAQIFLPIWLEKDFGKWSVYGGGGYWINPGVNNRNFGYVGIAVWREITEALHVGAEVFHQTPNVVNEPATTGFNVGLIYDVSDNWHLLSSVGTGAQNRTATNQLSYYAGLQLTF